MRDDDQNPESKEETPGVVLNFDPSKRRSSKAANANSSSGQNLMPADAVPTLCSKCKHFKVNGALAAKITTARDLMIRGTTPEGREEIRQNSGCYHPGILREESIDHIFGTPCDDLSLTFKVTMFDGVEEYEDYMAMSQSVEKGRGMDPDVVKQGEKSCPLYEERGIYENDDVTHHDM